MMSLRVLLDRWHARDPEVLPERKVRNRRPRGWRRKAKRRRAMVRESRRANRA